MIAFPGRFVQKGDLLSGIGLRSDLQAVVPVPGSARDQGHARNRGASWLGESCGEQICARLRRALFLNSGSQTEVTNVFRLLRCGDPAFHSVSSPVLEALEAEALRTGCAFQQIMTVLAPKAAAAFRCVSRYEQPLLCALVQELLVFELQLFPADDVACYRPQHLKLLPQF